MSLAIKYEQMAQYYENRPSAIPFAQTSPNLTDSENLNATQQAPVLSDYDVHHETLINDDMEEGWASELRRYLGRMERNVTKETDLVEWWQVRDLVLTLIYIPNTITHRTMHSYFLHWHVLLLMFSLLKLRPFLVKGYSQEVNRLRLTVGHP